MEWPFRTSFLCQIRARQRERESVSHLSFVWAQHFSWVTVKRSSLSLLLTLSDTQTHNLKARSVKMNELQIIANKFACKSFVYSACSLTLHSAANGCAMVLCSVVDLFDLNLNCWFVTLSTLLYVQAAKHHPIITMNRYTESLPINLFWRANKATEKKVHTYMKNEKGKKAATQKLLLTPFSMAMRLHCFFPI